MFSTSSTDAYVYGSTTLDATSRFIREPTLDGDYSAQSVPARKPQSRVDDDSGQLDARAVHEVLLQQRTKHNQVRLRAIVVLQMLHADSYHVKLGYPTFTQYCDREFGLPRSTALEYLRVAKALEGLPRIRTLFGEGSLSWQQVRCITRVATGKTETQWIQSATTESTRQLVAEVREAQRTSRDTPRPKRKSSANVREPYPFEGTLEDWERFRTAFEHVSRTLELEPRYSAAGDGSRGAGEPQAVFLRWVDGILAGVIPVAPAALTTENGLPLERATPAQTVVYHTCPKCRAARGEREGGR